MAVLLNIEYALEKNRRKKRWVRPYTVRSPGAFWSSAFKLSLMVPVFCQIGFYNIFTEGRGGGDHRPEGTWSCSKLWQIQIECAKCRIWKFCQKINDVGFTARNCKKKKLAMAYIYLLIFWRGIKIDDLFLPSHPRILISVRHTWSSMAPNRRVFWTCFIHIGCKVARLDAIIRALLS